MKRSMQDWLEQSYGEEGRAIYLEQKKELARSIDQIVGRTDSQRKTMVHIILPRVALYKALLAHDVSRENAVNEVGRYLQYELGPKAESYQKLSGIPFFFPLFKVLFRVGLRGDNWVTQNIRTTENGGLSFEITDCLWYNTCVENDCPNLCRVFCENDNLLYGDLKTVSFYRENTIAAGNSCCDFHFYKK